ncbi:MAG: hypothetical protein ACFFD4_39745, partial [Candidatus Odinarchaeota archaeon]
MNEGNFDIVELFTIMELSLYFRPEIHAIDLEELIEGVRSRLSKFVSKEPGKLPGRTPTTYVDILVNRQLIVFDTEYNSYTILQNCLTLGQALNKICSDFIVSANFEYFSSLIIRISNILEEWRSIIKATDKSKLTNKRLEEILDRLFTGMKEAEDYQKLMTTLSQLYYLIRNHMKEIRLNNSRFKTSFIQHLNQGLPTTELRIEIDNFIKEIENSFEKLNKVNLELKEILKANSKLIGNIQDLADELYFLVEDFIRILDDRKYSDIKDIIKFKENFKQIKS